VILVRAIGLAAYLSALSLRDSLRLLEQEDPLQVNT
jgi:hypothetical protein